MSAMTPQKWLDKAGWAGGIFEGLRYGLTAENLDDSDPGFNRAVDDLVVAYHNFSTVEDAFFDYADSKNYNTDF